MLEVREPAKCDWNSETQNSLSDPIGRIFIDVTVTAIHVGNSGIQRVVRNTVRHYQGVSEKYKIECKTVIWKGNGFVAVQKIQFRKSSEDPNTPKSFSFIRATLELFDPLVRVARIGLRALDRLQCTLEKRMERKRDTLTMIMHRCLKVFSSSLRRSKLILKNYILYPELFLQKSLKMQTGDLLLLLDSSWDVPFWRDVGKAKANGAKIAFVLYDLIPINAPRFCVPEYVRCFSEWLTKVIEVADYCVAISESAKEEFRQYLERHASTYRRGDPLKLGSFRLGADLDLNTENEGIRNNVRDILDSFERCRPYVVVSTIEPRKNHGYLLDAFELVWSAGIEAKLYVIGKIGWLCDEIVERIQAHPLWQKSLFMLNDVNDSELQFVYRHAKALICPSVYEGFGLPIVEALNQKLLVLASDIPVHREVGRNYCLYFGLESPENLAKLVIDLESQGQLPSHASSDDFHCLTWEQSCAELFEKIIVLRNDERETVTGLRK